MKRGRKFFMTASALVLAASMVVCFCACGDKEAAQDEKADMPNPVHECENADEIVKATGLDIDAPEGAEDVEFSYIEAGDDGAGPVAQVLFTLDGQEYCYRCKATDEISLCGGDGTEASSEKLHKSLEEQTNIGAELAGIYCDWESAGTAKVGNREAVFGVSEGEEGFVAWLDTAPGILYSLSVDKNADRQMLLSVAEKCFVPMQEEAHGEE